MMVESNNCMFNRMKLIYTYIAKLVGYVGRTEKIVLSYNMKHSTNLNDFIRVIYHQWSTDVYRNCSKCM